MYHRKPSYAGSFYPGDRKVLRKMIDSFIGDAKVPEIETGITGIIVPHAGYIYSGPIAAYSYAAMKNNRYDTAIILAPSHRAHFNGYSVIPSGEMETPLGIVAVDEKIGSRLEGNPLMSFMREIDSLEHSLEVQLPFLQVVDESISVVPVLIGTTDPDICVMIADEIYRAISGDMRNIIVVISTDLSHYYSYDEANKLDARFINSLMELDEKALIDAVKSGAEACGLGPVITGINLLKRTGTHGIRVLKHGNSGDTAGDKSKVVGYLSAVFTRQT